MIPLEDRKMIPSENACVILNHLSSFNGRRKLCNISFFIDEGSSKFFNLSIEQLELVIEELVGLGLATRKENIFTLINS